MKKVVLFSGLMFLVLLASCSKAEQEEVAAVLTNDSNTQVAQTQEVSNSVELAANYKDYDSALLGDSENSVIFFHAPYCGSCTATDKSLKDSGIAEGTQVLKTDFDTSLELRQKYGVTKYHTFVQVDSEGNLIKKWSGSMNADDILENVEETMMMKDEDKMMKQDDAMMKKDGDAMMEKGEDKMMKEDAMMKKDGDAMMAKTGTYADYNPALVGSTENTVVFFHANWCPSCRAADAGISGGEVPEGLTILKADFDSQTDLRKKYGVVSQHTFVLIDADGNEVKKWTGGTTVEDIIEKI